MIRSRRKILPTRRMVPFACIAAVCFLGCDQPTHPKSQTEPLQSTDTSSIGSPSAEKDSIDPNDLLPKISFDSFVDHRDNKTYKTLTIGTRTWLAENLAYLPKISGTGSYYYSEKYYWLHGIFQAYQSSEDLNHAKQNSIYSTCGVLYNWSAAKTACPLNWRLPTREEWAALIQTIGGASLAGRKMKSTGDWPERLGIKAEDAFGFSARPCGSYSVNTNRPSASPLDYTTWWSNDAKETKTNFTTMQTETSVHTAHLMDWIDSVLLSDRSQHSGQSVRCIKGAAH
jgi:uncharacterized protein (TIGR02145 family)